MTSSASIDDFTLFRIRGPVTATVHPAVTRGRYPARPGF
jgi:hypothetical protein